MARTFGLIVSLVFVGGTVSPAFAQIGMWPGAQGYGGLYNGYTGYRGYEMGYPANPYSTINGYNVSPYGTVIRRGPGVVYYSQPRFGTVVQPYGTPAQQPVAPRQTFDSATGGRIYSGSSPIVTSPVESVPNRVPDYDNGEIVVFSPPTNSVDVQYSLNDVTYTMKPGTLQKFANDRTWVIDVNPGTAQSVKYTLSTGRYKFKQTDSGVSLYTTKDAPEVPAPVPDPVPADDSPTEVPPPVPMPE